jgi:hypothetical protein
MKKSELKETIKSVVRETISERIQNLNIEKSPLGFGPGKMEESQGGMSIQKDYAGENDRMRKMEEERLTDEKKHKWLKGAIKKSHKGYCTPMTKSTCTPRRKALAMRFKKGNLSEEQILKDLNLLVEEEIKIKMGPSYKVAPYNMLRVQKDNTPLTSQFDPHMNEDKKNIPVEGSEEFQKIIELLELLADKVKITSPEKIREILLDLVAYLKQHNLEETSEKFNSCKGCGRVVDNDMDKCPKCREKKDKTSLPPKKNQRGVKDPDKVAGVYENHKVQHRSFTVANDTLNDPNNVRDPENPASNGA